MSKPEYLKAHCESMTNEGFDGWSKDVQALDIAFKALKEKDLSSAN